MQVFARVQVPYLQFYLQTVFILEGDLLSSEWTSFSSFDAI